MSKNLIASVDSLCAVAATIAGNARVWIKAGNSLRPIESVQAALAVHSGGFVSTVEANAASRELSRGVQASHLSFHLRVKVALVGVTKTLAHLAVVPRYELAGTPSLLVEHGAAGIAEGATGVVATLALIITAPRHRTVRSVPVAWALAPDGDVLDGVEILSGHAGKLWMVAVRQDGLV